jgi:hypothetical protein
MREIARDSTQPGKSLLVENANFTFLLVHVDATIVHAGLLSSVGLEPV